MGTNTKIEWATHTANAWIGCTKVSPACDHCYAERGSMRLGVDWGDTAYRRMTQWQPLAASVRRWDRAAKESGERHRVFWNSYSDFLESRPEFEIRREWSCQLMSDTTHLNHLILTKRPENAELLLPARWMQGMWPTNVWFGTTTENQEQADKRIPELLKVPAAVRFISAEPLLGPIDLQRINAFRTGNPLGGEMTVCTNALNGRYACKDIAGHWHEAGAPIVRLTWVIVGGESGPGARPMHPDWARSLRDQCQAAGVPFFFKQWGVWLPAPEARFFEGCHGRHWQISCDGKTTVMVRLGKKAAGRILDGRTWDEMPKVPA